MNYKIVDFLKCPVTNNDLSLINFNSSKFSFSDYDLNIIEKLNLLKDEYETEIINGMLLNNVDGYYYPIFNGIPRLLTFDHPLLIHFKNKFKNALENYSEYKSPQLPSFPGDLNVLKSFSKEWLDYDFKDTAYWGQDAELYNESLLSTLSISENENDLKNILEIGIGSGGTSNYIKNKLGIELFGVDLSYSVDVAYKNFKSPFFHPIQASVFQLPFSSGQFDFVFSHGVIHHTYSTHEAFKNVSKMPKPNGKLYVWVYSHKNEKRSFARRFFMLLENIIRPWLSRLPSSVQNLFVYLIAPLYMFHQMLVRIKNKSRVRYKWREAVHAARDRFTPLYIHRHTEEEVSTWFKEHGFYDIIPLSKRNLPKSVSIGFYANTGVIGIKN